MTVQLRLLSKHILVLMKRSIRKLQVAALFFTVIADFTMAKNSPVASVPSYIITPDDPTSVQRGIDAAARAGEKKVIVPPGIYRLPRIEGSPWHLLFKDLKDLKIVATGAIFVFEGRDRRSIHFDNCEGVTFTGATLLRDIPPFSQGKIEVIAQNRKSVDIRVDKGYPEDLDDTRYFPRIPVINLFQEGTRKLKPVVPDLYTKKVERLRPGLFRFFFNEAAPPAIPLAIGDSAAWRGPSGGDIDIWECSHMLLKDITIKNGTGIAFMELCGEGDNHYRHCVITYAPAPKSAVDQPLLACGTDGFHSASMRHGPTLEDCHFEGLDDDSVNIHGTYALLMGSRDRSIVVDWRTPHSAGRTLLAMGRPGDPLRFYNKKGALSGIAKIVSAKPKPDYIAKDLGAINSRTFSDRSKAVYWEVVLDHPVTGEPGGMVANPNQDSEGFAILNCTFRNSRAHGLFIRAGQGLIKGCTINGILMGGIVIAPELNSWNEADFASNVVMEKNTIENVGLGTQCWNSGVTVAGFEYGGFVPLPGGHRNIVIRNNLFKANRGPNLVITSAIGVKVVNNQFVRPMDEPAFHLEHNGIDNIGALIWMRNADQVSFEHNVVTAPGSYLKILVDRDNSVTAEGIKTGVAMQMPLRNGP